MEGYDPALRTVLHLYLLPGPGSVIRMWSSKKKEKDNFLLSGQTTHQGQIKTAVPGPSPQHETYYS